MYRGYIKLWRRLKDSDFWLKEKFTRGQAWVDLLMLANHSDGFIRKRGIRIDLKRGDLGWSERELSKRWKWSRGKVRRFLIELCSENESKLIPQNGPQNKNVTSYYHIKNYSNYQDNRTTKKPPNGPQTDRKRYQKNELYNDKNKDKRYTSNSIEIQLSQYLYDLILSINPKFKKRDLQKWAVHIDRAIRLDERTPEDLRAVIKWCQNDPFWQTNILSTRKLREKFDRLFMQMKGKKDGTFRQNNKPRYEKPRSKTDPGKYDGIEKTLPSE